MTLAVVINVAHENLYSDSRNISALQLDVKELQEFIKQDISLEEIGNVLGRFCSQVRAIKLRLHECQRPDNTVHTHTPISSPSPLPQSMSCK